MPTDQNPKQLVAQRLKDATNILVTVSHDPSVDALAAALALTLILDKLDKTPTAVFSGKIPPAIEFLEPGKTFDTNVDGLRDFIIALDKEKADRLRYKVEDDVVRVFITPYKTTITEKDLSFSQGDFNVDLVIAFGVEKREDLDAAIAAHGRILHDAAVITVNQLPGGSTLGEIDWSDTEASSLSEMLMSLTESLQSGLLDQPIATAILTGLVSATDRFRNEKTSPKVMTMAAQLMAAGANQQLIAEKLEEAETVSTGKLNAEATPPESTQPAERPKKNSDGEMKVEHEMPVSDGVEDAADKKANEVAAEESAEAVEEAKEELKKINDTQLPPVAEKNTSGSRVKSSSWRDMPAPATGGTLNATTDEAEQENREREADTKNHVILSHNSTPSLGDPAADAPVLNATALPPTEPNVKDIFTEFPMTAENPAVAPMPGPIQESAPAEQKTITPPTPPSDTKNKPVLNFEEAPLPVTPSTSQQNPTLADLEQQVHEQEAASVEPQQPVDALENARAAVDAALNTQPFNPAGQPLAASGSQPLGTVNHEDLTPAATPPATVPEAPAMAPLPPLPPLPDFSTLPPLPSEAPATSPAPSVDVPPALPSFGLPESAQPDSSAPMNTSTPASGDPTQFQLPGQN